ncbi:MAG: Flp pilus assembly complex ATPase component TadA, partial [Candidatus Cloacimonetes bacterium]|nr:Flp pilus assembly complex ATPase component TadA [Candidatus Cloacimonadota bacterium]
IGYTFSNALRTILRQDPDIIMVGEMRDHETAEIAIRSALTGHLVLSTLHTNDASSTINRLTNMGIESFLISSSVRMIVAQRLVRKICENCKTIYEPDIKVLNKLSLPLNAVYYHGKGCSYCNNTGFLGRMAAFEILVISEKISELIINQRNLTEIKIQAQKEGMKTLLEAAIEKVKTGITTPEEVIFKIISSH